MKKKWQVRLGEAEWARFTYPRPEGDLWLLGSVRRGAQMGALAIDAKGQYMQVNGDHLSPLSHSQVAAAVARAGAADLSHHRAAVAPKPAGKPPVIIVRKRRVIAVPS